ncbi:AAA family ATPase [Leifsonia sp. NPDC058292]|uniref:AAA family ATPase n=1 Tax=Leifsonia sp. NPDC058292 TaxID=3346428 RepID=UPI0036D91E44
MNLESTLLDDVFDASWLMQQHYDPVRYVVNGVIPEGLTMLVAAPKIGKSWMVLGLGLGLADGSDVFGTIPAGDQRPTLYLALEDGPRRLQSRLRALGASAPSHNLMFLTTVPKGDIVAAATEFVGIHAGRAPIVIIDTLGKVMPPAVGGESAYERDYRVGSALKAIADSVPGASVIVVHHSRKADASDFLDAVSGTQGLAGSADTILVLKRERHEKSATLHVTSRDAAEGEYALRIEGNGTWVLDGADLEEASSRAQLNRSTAGVGDRMAEVIAKIDQYPEGVTPRDLAPLLGMSNDEVGKYLRRAAESGRVLRTARGRYTPVRSVRLSEAQDLFGHSDGSDTPHQRLPEEPDRRGER